MYWFSWMLYLVKILIFCCFSHLTSFSLNSVNALHVFLRSICLKRIDLLFFPLSSLSNWLGRSWNLLIFDLLYPPLLHLVVPKLRACTVSEICFGSIQFAPSPLPLSYFSVKFSQHCPWVIKIASLKQPLLTRLFSSRLLALCVYLYTLSCNYHLTVH